MNDIIYLDNNATTRIDPLVLEAMMPFLTNRYGNASSNHDLGLASNTAVKESRLWLSKLIGCEEHEIFFTSGATEAINLVLKSIIDNCDKENPHIITCVTEHPAVLDTCKFLEQKGVKVTYLPVSNDGLINITDYETAFENSTVLACIMMVNNETGVIQSIETLAEIAHKHNVIFMSDSTQAVGKMSINVYELGIDVLCLSGHKFYAPKGIGALFLRSKRPFKPKVSAQLHGGGQEKGLRSGTLNVPGIVGIGKAAELSFLQLKKESDRIKNLRNKLETNLLKLPGTSINGSVKYRSSNTTSICFDGADADAIMVGLKLIAVSNGSACSSSSINPSHVLKAMGKSDSQAFSTIRFSLSRFTTEAEINEVVKSVTRVVSQLRALV
jgi:cysteine desulfurase